MRSGYLRMPRHLVMAVSVTILVLLIGATTALAALKIDGGGYSDTTYYNSLPYVINWTDYTNYYGYTGNPVTYTITGQDQGGCVQRTSGTNAYPFNQTVDGRVTFYWPGGSQGPVYSVNGGSVLCDSTSSAWGNALTSNSPPIYYISSDPAGTDYNSEFSQWTSTNALPGYFSRSKTVHWN